MPTIINDSAPLRRYYAILTGGVDQYRDGQELLPLLSDDFVFEGPIAGRMEGGSRFTRGAKGFIEAVQKITVIQSVITPDAAAVLYDAVLTNGTVRFTEFFEFDGDVIRELRIQYNAGDYLAAGGH
jgi:hypothetical protein